MIVLDTNALVWMAVNDRRLGRKARALITKNWSAGKIAVPAVAFWEAGLLVARQRLRLPWSVDEWRLRLLAAGMTEFPHDGVAALRALDLTGLPDDPADRFIAAIALVHGAALMTADEKILNWRHALERHDARV